MRFFQQEERRFEFYDSGDTNNQCALRVGAEESRAKKNGEEHVHAAIGDIDIRYREQPGGHRDQQQKKHYAHKQNLSRKGFFVNAGADLGVRSFCSNFNVPDEVRLQSVAGETPTPMMLQA